jgi:hypothetical protein
MDEYPNKIAAKLPDGVVHTGHRCEDVVKTDDGYLLTIIIRGEGKFTTAMMHATTVILATPPVSIRQFSVAKMGLNPVLFAVHQRRLG